MPVNAAFSSPSVLFRRREALVCALVVFLVSALAWMGLATAAGKYGKPLRFDPPPVDTGVAPDRSVQTVPPVKKGRGSAPAKKERASTPAKKEAASTPVKKISSVGAPEQAPPDEQETAPKEQGSAVAKPPTPLRLFGTVEFRSPIKNLPKWERVLGSEKSRPSFTANGLSTRNAQVVERWARLKEKLKGAPLMEKVQGVNKFFNQWPYKTDMEVWGVEDYWATPREFVEKSGDCEDYAISKYYALRDLGVPPEMLRIAAIKDAIRNLGHAVLVVFIENEAYVLDNLTNLVLSHKKLTHYAPQYTVNETFLWRHVKPKSVPAQK